LILSRGIEHRLIERQRFPDPERKRRVIGEIVIRERVHERGEAGCPEQRKKPRQRVFEEVNLELGFGMRPDRLVAHLADEQYVRELTRAARIEPRTPVGEVYVTSAFAALLALEPGSGIRCEYVGQVTTAKDFETIPMYRLRYA